MVEMDIKVHYKELYKLPITNLKFLSKMVASPCVSQPELN